jgi:hypothetical protein
MFMLSAEKTAHMGTLDQNKTLTKQIGVGRDVRVQRNNMGCLEGLLLFGASRRELREWRGK